MRAFFVTSRRISSRLHHIKSLCLHLATCRFSENPKATFLRTHLQQIPSATFTSKVMKMKFSYRRSITILVCPRILKADNPQDNEYTDL